MQNSIPMNAHDAAKVLGVGKNKIYDMAKAGELPSYRIGRKLLFRYEDLAEYLDKAHEGNAVQHTSSIDDLEDAINPLRHETTYVISGQGLSADAFIDQLELMGVCADRIYRTSYAGIVELYVGNADAAIVHLYDQRSNSFNIPYIQRLAPGLPVVAFRLIGRRQGFVVQKGNPKKVSTWGALLHGDVRLANRVKGCGARILLDEKLISMEANPYTITGYDSVFSTSLSAAEAVAAGLADVAVVDQAIAAAVEGAEFIPLQQEWLDIVVAKRGKGHQLVRMIKDVLSNKQFQETYATITGGDMSHFGSIVYEC